MSRLTPVSPEEFEAAVGVPVPAAGGASPVNLVTTMAHHGKLVRSWLPFGLSLMRGALPPRDRELLILRTGFRCGSVYEWGQHVHLARMVGLGDDEIKRVALGPEADGWSEDDRVLLRAADELHERSTLTDATWASLAARYDKAQLVELPMLVGHYTMVAFTASTLGVAPDAGMPGFP